MKLLVLIHRLPCPPDRGAKLRAAAELRWLAARHQVWCAGFIDPPGDDEPGAAAAIEASLSRLRAECRAVEAIPLRRSFARLRAMVGLCGGGTATEAYFASSRLCRTVLRWSCKVGFDAVLAFSSSMAPLALEVPARRRVLDFVDLDSRKWAESANRARWPMNWVYRTEARRLARREREWMTGFDATVLCTPREAELVSDPLLRQGLHVIETGAAAGTLSAGSAMPVMQGGAGDCLPSEPVVGFLGAMDYGPNVDGVCWFAKRIWPLIIEKRPDARLLIVGRSPSKAVRNLGDGDRIEVTGAVPEVEPHLRRMRVMVAPLRLARGLQTKVLTAMAMGRPCVVTPCVAEGIGAQAGQELLVAELPGAFAAAVTEVLGDEARAAAVGRAGRRFVIRRYRIDDALARLERLLVAEPTVGGAA
ncbi:MAG TPA: TIGR03087 family PEP-CTERM/XrtA system glycosyltransferase [Phycisphaerae bacterium]|nr:TIGR03087 family PEP-CTERM/XrtA system glycosyltransferase [Phycisphaerae bacterium]HRY68976.1 TIGR03087 family PEP-CTERM/XrtA system glycosyltransferase [Phycisphaerae bacterium]HSA26050.1 TIGR03087 family PEP-CTERM/XrtA system glycosyltransferase [Phycisphaerae bacterium]